MRETYRTPAQPRTQRVRETGRQAEAEGAQAGKEGGDRLRACECLRASECMSARVGEWLVGGAHKAMPVEREISGQRRGSGPDSQRQTWGFLSAAFSFRSSPVSFRRSAMAFFSSAISFLWSDASLCRAATFFSVALCSSSTPCRAGLCLPALQHMNSASG